MADPITGAVAAAGLITKAIGLLAFAEEVMNEPALSDEQMEEDKQLQKGSVKASLDATERWKARQAAANETPPPST